LVAQYGQLPQQPDLQGKALEMVSNLNDSRHAYAINQFKAFCINVQTIPIEFNFLEEKINIFQSKFFK
jgi:hypothetical protein